MPEPRSLLYTEVAQLARATSFEVFAVRLGGPVLVGQTEYEVDDGWSFNTDSNICAIGGLEQGKEFVLHREDKFLIIKKAQVGMAFASTVLIGRAQSNDVQISHTSVSKLHARIQIGEDGSYSIADAESQNGTILDTRRLKPNQYESFAHGDWVKFGECSFQFVALDHLYAALRRNG